MLFRWQARKTFTGTMARRSNRSLSVIGDKPEINEVNDRISQIKINLTTHTARHTFATTVTLENDVPLETVSKMLGHKSIKTTQIYAKITQRKVSNNMELLKSRLFDKDGIIRHI